MSHVLRNHPTASALFLLWLGLWLVMAATWLYDSAGYTVGMPMPVFFIFLAAPLPAGLIAGWSKPSLRSGAAAGLLAGALFGAANLAGNLLWGAVLFIRGRIPPNQPFTFWEGVAEALGFLVLFVFVGLVLGSIGGLLGAALGGRAGRRAVV